MERPKKRNDKMEKGNGDCKGCSSVRALTTCLRRCVACNTRFYGKKRVKIAKISCVRLRYHHSQHEINLQSTINDTWSSRRSVVAPPTQSSRYATIIIVCNNR